MFLLHCWGSLLGGTHFSPFRMSSRGSWASERQPKMLAAGTSASPTRRRPAARRAVDLRTPSTYNMYIWAYVQCIICIRIRICICICTDAPMTMSMYMCVHMYMYVCMRMCMCVCVCMYAYFLICIHIYASMHI